MSFYFIYNDKSSKEYKLLVESIPPCAGDTLTIRFAYELLSRDKEVQYIKLKKWLKGEGELTLSTGPNYFRRVTGVALKEIEKNKTYVVCEVIFTIEEYIYLREGKEVISFSIKNFTIYEELAGDSNPIIKVFGSGYGTLNVNGNINTLYISNGFIIIDSDKKDCYTGLDTFANNDIDGKFPILKNGDNTISFSGGITKVEMIPNWRV